MSQYYIKLFVAAFITVSLAINISINIYANVFAQAGLINPNKINVREIATKKVHVGDIDIAYKIFGKGQPVLLINGFSAPLDFWEPTFLGKLASNHTVVTFDNRGIGNTTSGDNKFTIPQFANDASGLLDALNISNADIIGWSMGGMIAQELALTHPDKVGKLIIYASTCGGKETVQPNPEIVKTFGNWSGSQSERLQRLVPLLFPEAWLIQNLGYLQNLPKTSEIVPIETLNQQTKAIINWAGTCGRLNSITQPTLVIIGTNDILTVPVNSLLITDKIPGAILVGIQGGGHGLMFQYPEKFSMAVLNFLQS